MKNVNIAIVATAAKFGGSKSIIDDFINHIDNSKIENIIFHFFLGYKFEHTLRRENNFRFIFYPTGSNFSRIYFDLFGLKKFEKSNNLKFDTIISFQNNGICSSTNPNQLIYFHNPIAFSTNIIPIENIRTAFLKYFYVIYFWFMLRPNYKIFVQLDFVKNDLIANGVKNQISVIRPNLKSLEIQPKTKVNKEEFNLIFPATPYKYKNHRLLIEAIRILKSRGLNFQKKINLYLTALDDKTISTFSTLTKKYGVDDIIILLGRIPVNDLICIYEKCDVLVFPSLLETYGIPLFDAAVAGIPIIASDLPYAKNVLDNYTCKVFVNPYDSSAWADAIYNQYLKSELSCSPLFSKFSSNWDLLLEEI
jgi:glycosyltransferase involved in cell wall biosynthesis